MEDLRRKQYEQLQEYRNALDNQDDTRANEVGVLHHSERLTLTWRHTCLAGRAKAFARCRQRGFAAQGHGSRTKGWRAR